MTLLICLKIFWYCKQVETLDNKEAQESEPYKWKYEARDLLISKKDEYTSKLSNENEMKTVSDDNKNTLNDELNITTYVKQWHGVISIRFVEIKNNKTDVILVTSHTEWCMLDSKSFRPKRVTEEIIRQFE